MITPTRDGGDTFAAPITVGVVCGPGLEYSLLGVEHFSIAEKVGYPISSKECPRGKDRRVPMVETLR